MSMPSVTEEELPISPSISPNGSDSFGETPPSQRSRLSFASSFNFFSRDRKDVDKRLLRKRSKPHQHTLQPTSPSKPSRPPTIRSSSFYKPKIVQDTFVLPSTGSPTLLPTTPRLPQPPRSPSSTHSPTPPSPSLIATPVGKSKDRSSSPHSPWRSSRSPASKPAGFSKASRHSRSGANVPRKASLALHQDLHVDISDLPDQKEHLGERRVLHSDPQIPWYQGSSISSMSRNQAPFTPLDILPSSPAMPRGDDYFPTFGEDTVYEKQNVARAKKKGHSNSPDSSRAGQRWDSRFPLNRASSVYELDRRKAHERSSVAQVLPTGPVTDSAILRPIKSIAEALPSPLRGLHTKTARPQLAISRRKRSISGSAISVTESSTSSYFGPGRQRQSRDSDNLAPSSSPMVTRWDAVAADSGHAGERSEPLSPLTVPQSRLKWTSPLDARPAPDKVRSMEKLLAQAPKTLPNTLRDDKPRSIPAKYKSTDGREYPIPPLTGPEAPNFLPSEMKRVNTPPTKEDRPGGKKLRGFRSLFFDALSLPSHDEPPDDSSSTIRSSRRKSILPKTSLQSLLPKISLPGLKRKPSQIIEDTQTPDPLKVTDFHQTPFSQRYGDARRAKMALVRSYVEEMLGDNDDSGASQLQFEFNVPDHLPNSPLCPLNDKQGTRGQHLCPMHGRKGSAMRHPPTRGRPARRAEDMGGTRHQPTIVFESSDLSHGRDGGFGEHCRNADRELRRML